MRIPLPPDNSRPIDKSIHYLTDFYAQTQFKLEQVPFSNASNNAYYRFYGDLIQISGVHNVMLLSSCIYAAHVVYMHVCSMHAVYAACT